MEFSVLMSVYYKENPEYLKRALDSILNQTITADEIVLIKDGPLTKELDDAIANYEEKYIAILRVLSLENNVGLGEALNYGVRHCKYDLIARMDTDDIALPTRFELQMKEFIENKELALCGGQIAEFENDPQIISGYRKVPLTQAAILKFAKKRNTFNHVTVMFRKQAILESGNYQDMPYFEDYWLWVRMLQKGYIVKNIENILVNVCAGEKMLSRRHGKVYLNFIYKFCANMYKIKFCSLTNIAFIFCIRGILSVTPRKILEQTYKYFCRRSSL